jgi:hypothetical protein
MFSAVLYCMFWRSQVLILAQGLGIVAEDFFYGFLVLQRITEVLPWYGSLLLFFISFPVYLSEFSCCLIVYNLWSRQSLSNGCLMSHVVLDSYAVVQNMKM